MKDKYRVRVRQEGARREKMLFPLVWKKNDSFPLEHAWLSLG